MILERLGLAWQRWKTRRKMERVFGRGEDPFRYESNAYESARLAAMDQAAGPGPFNGVLEAGCAEGLFTERLLARARRVTALDISPTALARARRRLAQGGVDFIETDLRDFRPPLDRRYGLIVLGDILYYLDKPMARAAFEEVFPRVASWLEPGGRLLLAHGFAGESELAHRRGFRERFELAGLSLITESVIDGGPSAPTVNCLLSVMRQGS